MSMLTRFLNRLWPRRLDRDLHDEVDFHIALRAREHSEHGMSADAAFKEAREQFGDTDSVIAAMRHARLTPVRTLVMATALSATVVTFFIGQQRMRSLDLDMPALPQAPPVGDPDRPSGSPPPPPPGRGPTWEQYVKQSNAFKKLQEGPGTYSPGRLVIHDTAKTR